MNKIYAISIRQPWAELILSGKKTVELRSWSTEYRGSLWIHTGRQHDPKLEGEFGLSGLFHGGYLGVVTLVKIVSLDQNGWENYRPLHCDPGEYQKGYYGWFLGSPLRFAVPILGPGQLGLYYPDEDIEEMLDKAHISAKNS